MEDAANDFGDKYQQIIDFRDQKGLELLKKVK
jgi:hypothetical protein